MKKTCVRLASLGALLLNSSLAMEHENTDLLNTNHESPSSEFITLKEWPNEIISMIEVGVPNYRMDKSDSQNKLKEDLQAAKKSNDKLSFRVSQVSPENIIGLNKILSPYAENINYLFIKLHPYCRSPNLPEMLKGLSIIENLIGLGVEDLYVGIEKKHVQRNCLKDIKALSLMKNHTKYALTPGKEFVVFFKNDVIA